MKATTKVMEMITMKATVKMMTAMKATNGVEDNTSIGWCELFAIIFVFLSL
eukprot:CAMPEP_0178507786 /NCGR_PEP_ID=MMETSP0696-20121128/20403_1 /TAXON_ID=265572 /ORGANISM="Extubocellulus spinifer, Strain CCMP396" /LENGTH=50 /DNA_ID=CAMNT_0020137293 /DNA_START=486 /DNA_END=635 /DNA_ORIENTATION=-